MADSPQSQDEGTTYREIPKPLYEYGTLDLETTEQRFLTLFPCSGDKNAEENHVRCSIETCSLADAQPFIAVRNSRGYRLINEVINIDGAWLVVPVAVERFLRHFRRENEPVRLWLRHICLRDVQSDERAKYWNREFFERMYEDAIEVVDMAVFNTHLLETETIQTVFDSRYMQWTKEWDNTETRTRLPQVYPIRVGQKPSMTEPTDRFAYVPLDLVTNEIRLLVLHHSADSSEIIKLHLAHAPIKSETLYQAVSYTWGDREATTDIIINGQLFTITKSLDQFLRDIRSDENELCLWIDAICIDQSNDFERDRHLRRMARVYDTAGSVIASLGSQDEAAELALEFIPLMQTPMLRINALGEWDIGQEGQFSPDELARHCAATYKFLTMSYFHRVWILQEIAWASSPVGVSGNHAGFNFWSLENAARNLQDMLSGDPELVERMKTLSSGSLVPDPTELDFIRKMFYFRHLISRGRGSNSLLWNSLSIPKEVPGFLEAAILARSFGATDPHDKIFALWNLAQDKDGLEFDMSYTDSVPESFTKFARAWMTQHKSLDIIAVAERDPKSRTFYETAPSWCPDWTVPSGTSNMVRRENIPRRPMMSLDALDGKLYNADGGISYESSNDPYFSFHGNKLLCTGIVVDALKWVIDPGPTKKATFQIFAQAITQFYASEETNPYEDEVQALWAMCHGDVPSTWPPRAPDDGRDEDYYNKLYKGDRDSARHFYRYVTDIGERERKEVMEAVIRGRTLGFTEKGYMCLVPYWMKPQHREKSLGQPVLAVLAGCSTPVLLHKLENGEYTVAGSAFVQGWMEGEFIEKLMGAESPNAFWTSRLSETKMCIR